MIVRPHVYQILVKNRRIAVLRTKFVNVIGLVSAERVGKISLMRAGGEDELCRKVT
jgi:hypothetical protein